MDMKFARGLVAMALSFAAAAASAQTTADLRNDAATPGDVTTYGMGWSLQRHTPLKQITPANVEAAGAGVEPQPGQLGQRVEPAAGDRRRRCTWPRTRTPSRSTR